MPSYEQSKSSKLWSVRFRIIDNGMPRQKRLSGYKTKREAQAGYVDFMASYKPFEEPPKQTDALTFDQLVEAYLRHQRDRIKESSYYDTESKINNRIVPFFKDRVVAEIKPADVLAWQQSLDGYSYKYKSTLRGYLSGILKYADKYYEIPSVMPRVDSFRNLAPPKEMLFWIPEEFFKFANTVERFDYRTFFTLLYITGCRKGEALAIRWGDINFDRGTITIDENITRKVKGKAWDTTTTKNRSSMRTVSIPPSMCAMLQELRERTEKRDSDAFVFGGERPFADRTTDRIFERACEKAGVKKIRLHDLRHSCASLLISQGVSIVAVSRRLGHKNIEQTLNTYSHMMPSDESRMMEVYEALNVGTLVGTESK